MKTYVDGNLKGTENDIPILDTREYVVTFDDSTVNVCPVQPRQQSVCIGRLNYRLLTPCYGDKTCRPDHCSTQWEDLQMMKYHQLATLLPMERRFYLLGELGRFKRISPDRDF